MVELFQLLDESLQPYLKVGHFYSSAQADPPPPPPSLSLIISVRSLQEYFS